MRLQVVARNLVFLFLSTMCSWLAACGDDGSTGDPPDAPPVNGVDASQTDGSPADGGPPGSCEAAAQALAQEMYQTPQTCSAVVRMDYQTYEVIGYQLFCGSYTTIDENQARATAQADTGYGATGTALSGQNPEDVFVFFLPAGDFGGSAAVSARSGLSVFGGSTVWGGTGDITYPSAWRPAEDLSAMCPPSGGVPRAHGYDLEDGEVLATQDVDLAVAVVAQTALPDAFWRGGYVFDALVLRYPRSVGVFEPASAEWIVVLSGGWLE